ncbi:MAG: flagellar filament capping protein FliD [Terracidiphilus sp.]
MSSSSSSSTAEYDLSSILEAALGASSSGIDVTSAVDSAVSAAQAPEDTWESQESTLESQISAMSSMETDVTTLDTEVQDLNSLTGPLSAMTVSSSNSDVISASASSGASTGSHVVVVNSLAATASWTSGTFTSSSTDLPSGNFTITNGSGTSATITTDGTETLSDVASEINNDDLGLTASVITDTSGARLAIVADSSGADSNFTVASSDSSDFGFTQAVTGANASLTVDGISISSASNTVTGAIPDVTLSLLSADPGVDVSLSISPDTSSIESAIQSFITDYNTVVSDLNTQYTVTDGSEGVLATDSTVRDLQNDILGAIDYTYTPSSGTTTVPNLTSLGISVDNNGKLSLDTSTLDSALQNNFSDVQSFFQGTSLNGFANSLDEELTSFTSSSDGAFTVDLQNMNSQVTDLQNNISNFETNYIDPLKTQLQTDYSDAEEALQELPTQIKQIDEELGYNTSS